MYVDMGEKNLFVKAKAGKHNSVGEEKKTKQKNKKTWLLLGGDKRCFGRRLTWCSFCWETLSQRGLESLPVLLEVGIIQIHAIWSKDTGCGYWFGFAGV